MTIIPQLEHDLRDAARARLGPPPRTRARFAAVPAVAVALAVAALFVGLGAHGSVSPAAGGVRLTFTAVGPDGRPAGPVLVARAVRVLRARLALVPGARVSAVSDTVLISAPGARAAILALTAPGRLAFYDWEADVLAMNGRPVAAQLPAGSPDALELSQGLANSPPGAAASGGVTWSAARRLAAHVAPIRTVILQAVSPGGPVARFFVLRDDAALTGRAIADPRASAGAVSFTFTASGDRAFARLTTAVARRGDLVSLLGRTLEQHFAVALDGRIVAVPAVDFRVYPDGISGTGDADLTGAFPDGSPQVMATLLRSGPLPVILRGG